MKALITGAGGFVGPYLKKHLLDQGFEVLGTSYPSNKGADFVTDIVDRKKVDELIKKTLPDFIFHLAAQSSVKLSIEHPDLTWDVNVRGTQNLLDAVKKYVPDSRILIVGSADVYGTPKKTPLKENSELNPISPYGKSRLEQERMALGYGLNLMISRSFNHTGPGQTPIFVCSDFAKQIAEIEKGKRKVVSTGNLRLRRDFSDVRDIVRAYGVALKKCDFNEVYNICSGNSYSIKEILEILISLSDSEIKVKEDPSKIREKDIPLMEGDNSKFCHRTGWKTEIPFNKTLKDLLDYWRGFLERN